MQRLHIHSLSKIRGVKSLEAALIILHFTSRPRVCFVSAVCQPGGNGAFYSLGTTGAVKTFIQRKCSWANVKRGNPQMRTVCFNEALHSCHPYTLLNLCSHKIDEREIFHGEKVNGSLKTFFGLRTVVCPRNIHYSHSFIPSEAALFRHSIKVIKTTCDWLVL